MPKLRCPDRRQGAHLLSLRYRDHRGEISAGAAAALLVALALFMGRLPAGDTPRYVTAAAVAVAVVIVALRAYARRR